ncbi:MAG: discoidin domain-containing protein [Flexilinea sp.]
MEKMVEKRKIIITIVFFLIFFVIGLLIYDDYGVNVDDLYERNTGIITLKYILQNKLNLQSLPDEITNAADLLSYEDKDYGVVLQMPVVLFEYFNDFKFDLKAVVRIRHLWVFLNFFTATIFFYLLIYKRFTHWFYSLIAVIFLILSPRIFADAFYNIKDLLFLSWFIISLYFFIRFVCSPTVLNDIFLSITIALSSNVRIIGLMVLFFSCLFLLIKLIRKEIKFSRFFLLIVLLIGVTGSLWIFFLPSSWESPVKFLFETLAHFSNYDLIQPEFYLGKMVSSDALPWHYIPVWIGITTPILYIFLFLIGLVLIVFVGEKKFSENIFIDISMLVMFFLPIIMVIVFHSTLYNGWRHLYFIYGPFLYIAVYGYQYLMRSGIRLIKPVIGMATVLSLTIILVWMIRNHPYQMVFYNILVRENAAYNFERDYWRFSSCECLEFIINQEDNLRIAISDYDATLSVAQYALTKQDRDRLSVSSVGFGGQPAKYIIANYSDTVNNQFQFPFYTPIYHVKVDQMKIASVFQRDHQNELWSQDIVDNIRSNINQDALLNIFDGDFDTGWTTGRLQNDEDYLQIQFDDSITLDGLTFYLGSDDNECPWSLQLFSSDDGIQWTPIEITYRGITDYTFEETRTKYLRIKNSESSEQYSWSVNELLFYGKVGE